MGYSLRNTLATALPNIFGTSVTQGLRIGPSAAQGGSQTSYADGNSPSSSVPRLNLDQWGPGVYTGGLFTYRISPTPMLDTGSDAPKVNNLDNIVAQLNIQTTNAGQYFDLATYGGNPRATQLIESPDGTEHVVFDYPRCVTVYTSASQSASLNIKIWGWDLYGQQMMETITTTPATLLKEGQKAFQGIYAVYFDSYTGTFAAGEYFAVGTSNAFGLPFALNQACHVVAYSQGDVDLQDVQPFGGWQEGSSNFPYVQNLMAVNDKNGDLGIVNLPYQFGTPQYVYGADPRTASPGTLDVRGVVKPGDGFGWTNVSSPFNFDTAAASANWSIASEPWITITYYIAGADMYQDIIQAQINTLKTLALRPSSFDGMWRTFDSNTPPRDQNNIKGVVQYWEEPPIV